MNHDLPRTALDAPIHDFLAHYRALGRGYGAEEHGLRGLRDFLVRESAHDLDQTTFDLWCRHLAHLAANTLRNRQQTVHRFCQYRSRNEPDCFVPDPLSFARPQPYRAPVLVKPEQVARMLGCADTLPPSANSPLRAEVLRLATVLLYTAGLRRGEVLALTLADVDDEAGIIRVRESKFHKSRFVPLSESAHEELCRYLDARLAADGDVRPSAPLLCNRSRGWRPYTGTGLRDGIIRLFGQAGVRDTQHRRPRVHDLRHSFAVESLTRLYRRGEDVQSRLPHLALYMGHVSIASTAYYLHFVPALAALASERFALRCGHLIRETSDEHS